MSDQHDARVLYEAAVILRNRNRKFMTQFFSKTLTKLADEIRAKEQADDNRRANNDDHAFQNWQAKTQASKGGEVN